MSPSTSCLSKLLIPQGTFLVSGEFLKFTKIIINPHSTNQPHLCCLNEAATFRLPQLLLRNEIPLMTLPKLASIRLFSGQLRENVFTLLGFGSLLTPIGSSSMVEPLETIRYSDARLSVSDPISSQS